MLSVERAVQGPVFVFYGVHAWLTRIADKWNPSRKLNRHMSGFATIRPLTRSRYTAILPGERNL